MKTPETSRLFTAWRDPGSGVESLLLTEHIAPIQQSFYFVNPGFTPDGRFLWFYCAFPPAGRRVLGVVDFEADAVRFFPETEFLDGSPCVDPVTGAVFWVSDFEIWRRGPLPADRPQLVNKFPEELAPWRRPHRIATHLTFSADRRSFNIDAQLGAEWFVGEAPLDGAPVTIWQKFDRCYNHAQFSPVDPDLMLIAQDWWHDPLTGKRGEIENRLWLIRRGGKARPIFTDGSPGHARDTHEWWAPDGKQVWFVNYQTGTARVDIATGARQDLWSGGNCHAHADRSGQYLAGDIGPYDWERGGCRVAFFNRMTGREVNIASALPFPEWGRDKYHLDPHPQFCVQDRYVCYTTTVTGRVTLAVARVAQLIELTQSAHRKKQT